MTALHTTDLDPGHLTSGPRAATAGVELLDIESHPRTDTQLRTALDVDLTGYRMLRVAAEMFFDAQETRKRVANRALRSVQATGTPTKHTLPEWLAFEIDAAQENEHRMRLVLRRQFKAVAPKGLLAWQKENVGIGVDILARVVGHLGHPRVATPFHWEGTGSKRELVAEEPFERTVSQLWQYCGHGKPGRPTKGMTAEEFFALGNPTLKMLVHLMTECAVKQPGRSIATLLDPGQPSPDPHHGPAGVEPSDIESHRWTGTQRIAALDVDSPHPAKDRSVPSDHPPGGEPSAKPDPVLWPYRKVYEERRLATVGRLHNAPCVRCGPAGKPKQPGEPWSDAHANADALRIVGKTILRDMWEASR